MTSVTTAIPTLAVEPAAKAPEKAAAAKKPAKKPAAKAVKKKPTVKKDATLGKTTTPKRAPAGPEPIRTVRLGSTATGQLWVYDGPTLFDAGGTTCLLRVERPQPIVGWEFLQRMALHMDVPEFAQFARSILRQEADSKRPLSPTEQIALRDLLELGCRGTPNFA